MKYLNDILAAIGLVVDKLVPVGVGSRTKFAVIACPLLGIAAPVLSVVPGGAQFAPIVPLVQHVLCVAAPALAVAGLVRSDTNAKK